MTKNAFTLHEIEICKVFNAFFSMQYSKRFIEKHSIDRNAVRRIAGGKSAYSDDDKRLIVFVMSHVWEEMGAEFSTVA